MRNEAMATHTPDLFSEDHAVWLEDLHEGLLCLVLHSASAPLLQETSQNLQNLWLQAQAGQVEVFNGQHCQDIIRRFNEQVAAHFASIAALPPDPDRPAHLWIVKQAQALSSDQVHLLGQMLVHLPGVNIRLVLLHEGDTPVANWNEATEGLADTHELLPPPPPPIDMVDVAANADEEPLTPQAPTAQDTVLKHRRKWQLGVAGLAVFAFGFVAGRISAPSTPSSAAIQEVAPLPPSTVATPVPKINTTAPAPATAAATTSAVSDTASAASGADMRWLRQLPTNSFVVLHDSFADVAAAQAYRGKHAMLKTARIVPVKTAGQTRYALVSGPFRSEERTRGFMSRLDWKKSARVLPHQQVINDMNAALDK